MARQNESRSKTDGAPKKTLVVRELSPESILFFRDQLRAARDAAIRNSEDYHDALFAIERLGQYVCPEGNGLGQYLTPIQRALDISSDEFEPLYTAVAHARNDALHQGAFARHLTANAIRLLIKLEGFLMTKYEKVTGQALTIEHYMVRNPVCAESWMPVSFVRQLLLANSFSSIPVLVGNEWRFLFDVDLVNYAQGKTGNARKERLAKSIADACATGLRLVEARLVSKEMKVTEFLALEESRSVEKYPVLVVRKMADGEVQGTSCPHLVGILSAFDLL